MFDFSMMASALGIDANAAFVEGELGNKKIPQFNDKTLGELTNIKNAISNRENLQEHFDKWDFNKPFLLQKILQFMPSEILKQIQQ